MLFPSIFIFIVSFKFWGGGGLFLVVFFLPFARSYSYLNIFSEILKILAELQSQPSSALNRKKLFDKICQS